jgi:hypothetical protein
MKWMLLTKPKRTFGANGRTAAHVDARRLSIADGGVDLATPTTEPSLQSLGRRPVRGAEIFEAIRRRRCDDRCSRECDRNVERNFGARRRRSFARVAATNHRLGRRAGRLDRRRCGSRAVLRRGLATRRRSRLHFLRRIRMATRLRAEIDEATPVPGNDQRPHHEHRRQ